MADSPYGAGQSCNERLRGAPFRALQKKLANNRKKLANFGFWGVFSEKSWPTSISKLATFQFIEEIQGRNRLLIGGKRVAFNAS